MTVMLDAKAPKAISFALQPAGSQCPMFWRVLGQTVCESVESCRALSLDGWRHVTFIDDGLGALTALRGVASLNLQGCATLTDKGLEAIAHMTSLTSVNLQDCRQISGDFSNGLMHHCVCKASTTRAVWCSSPSDSRIWRGFK